MRMRSALFVFMPLAALLAGCPVWGSNDDDGGGSNPDECRTHGDCRIGYYCDASEDECTPSETCDDDEDCDASEHCDFRDTCVPDVPGGCRTTADCSGSEVCVEGFCRNVTTGPDNEVCQFNYQCGGGRICVDNVCTPQCTNDASCGSGQSCVSNRCVPNNDQCDRSSDCDDDAHCVDGRCLPDCRDSGTCEDGQDECSTDDQFCRPDWQPNGFCDDDSDCNAATGSVCDLVDHVCRVKCGGCTVDTDCRPMGSGTATCDTGSGLCVFDSGDPDGTATAGEFCQLRDVQLQICDAGDGYCHTTSEGVAECQTPADCDAGESCEDGQCE